MNNDKFHCPKCKLLFDSVNHLPRILNICNHNICSYCIKAQLHNTPKQICCPIDKTIYNNISSISIFKENTNLIEELQESLNIPSNHNYEISNEDIFFDKSGIMNSDKFNDTMNSLNLNSSIMSSSHCYYKKSKDIRINLGENNTQICNVHTLPLNVICIDERKKICSQCALNNEHVNHQIITENEFMNNIDNLIDLFQEVDNNQIKYLNFNSINTKSTLDKIGNNIDNLIKMINTTKNDIINNIKEQCEHIEEYLYERKKEIFDKYQSTCFDISTLRESTLNWMQTVTNKLDQLNDIKDPSSECIKLLDNEPNKNLFNLIRNGKQLNGRYNFIQEMLKIIHKLESFYQKGILIKPNKNIIDRIFFKEDFNNDNIGNKQNKNEEEKEEDDIEINLNIDELGKKNNLKNDLIKKEKQEDKKIRLTLFEIEENKELINSLHLTEFKFDFHHNKINDEKEDLNDNKYNNNKNEADAKDINKDNNNNTKKLENLEEINKSNIIKEDNSKVKGKESNDVVEDEEIILNLNINDIKSGNEKYDKNKKENKNDKFFNRIDEKNNISKIIDDLSFNDDTLLINPSVSNQNETIYHKKIKNDYPIELKNKKKENSILEKNNQNINEILNQNQDNTKSIKTKKIDISELNKSNKILDQKRDILTNNHKNNNKNIKNSFSINGDTRSIGNGNENISYNIHNKNEVMVNISKRLSASKKSQPICANYTKSEKKNDFMKHNGDWAPALISRSPGRMTYKSKLAGFYSFVPLEKNKNKKGFNDLKNNDKTLISDQDNINNKNKIISEKYQFKNCNNNNIEDDNDINKEYSSNSNVRRTSFCINKNIKKMKTLSKDIFTNNNKTIKKINSTKIVNNIEEKNGNKNKDEKYDITNFNSNKTKILTNNNLLNSASNLIINNTSNSYENKSKKELQEFINNQLKNNKPNFSRINMNGYGTQYLCSFLHKNPNIHYKEIKLLGCNLNDDDLFILTRTLLDHDIGLLVLNLSSNKITDESASNILDILKDCKYLKGLSLYNNMISNVLKEKLKEYAKLGRKNFEMVQLYI